MGEIWKYIGDTKYQISNNGEVRNSKTLRILKIHDYKGSVRVCLFINKTKQRFKVHRLVAEAFIPNPENKPEVDHKDRNPLNNHVDNLRWATREENCRNRFYGIPKDIIEEIVGLSKSGKSIEDIFKTINKIV